MKIEALIEAFSTSVQAQRKAIFSTLFIAGNRLQTLFDHVIPQVTLKQFMLLSILHQAKGPLTLTQLGNLLGCSRQNIKKLAKILSKKGFITIEPSQQDARALVIAPTDKVDAFFHHDFLKYQEDLNVLFQEYSKEEIETLFLLLSKLYAGIDHLEEKVRKDEGKG